MEEVGKILPRVFGLRGAPRDAALRDMLAALWEPVAGPAVAAHSHPVAIANGALTLSVSSAAWAVALKQMAEELRASINAYLGRPAIKKLRIVVSTAHSSAEVGARLAPAYEVEDETVSRLERMLARTPVSPKG